MTVSPNTFTCANIGGNTVTLTVTDINGNSATCTATVTVQDVTPPTANCQNLTVQLSAGGTASITAAQVNNGSTDACGLSPTMTVTPSTFNCSDVTGDPVGDLIISEYIEGNVGSNKYIELYNGTAGNINLGNYRLRLYANGATSPTNDVLLSGTLNAGQAIVYQNSAATLYVGAATNNAAVNFNGDDAVALFKVSSGTNVDIFGRIGEDPGTAWTLGGNTTVDQTLRRKSTVTQGVTVNPAAGFPTLATEWDQFAPNDVTGLGAHTLNGGNLVTLTVNDLHGNSSTCTAYVTVQDLIAPTISCPAPITVSNTTGQCGAIVNYTAPVGTDNCTVPTVQTAGLPPGSFFPIGVTTNTFVITDNGGNTASCSFDVTVNDTELPTISCPAPITVNNTPGQCNADVTVPAVAVGDNCAVCNTDNLDTYTTGIVSGQSPQWIPWFSNPSALVSTDQFLSAPNSLKVTGTPAYNSSSPDQLFLLGNQTSGSWTLTFKMFVGSGHTAQYNLQHFETPAIQWAHQVEFYSNATGLFWGHKC